MKNFGKVLASIVILLIVIGCSIDQEGSLPSTNTVTNTVTKKKWTVMVYLDGDNNLEPAAIEDVNEMEANPDLTNGDLNVIVLMDRAPGYSTADGDWTGTRLYQIKYDPNGVDSTMRSTRLAGMGLSDTGDSDELNMADPANVSAFVDFVKSHFPATNTMIIFWNHGGGWRAPVQRIEPTYQQQWKQADVRLRSTRDTSKTFSEDLGNLLIPAVSHPAVTLNQPTQDVMKDICMDETSGNDILNNSEVRAALTGKGINVVGFDACLMGMFETAYELRGVADYMVGSADSEPGDGWEYDQWISGFLSSGMTTGDLLTNIVNAYATRYASTAATTMAAYDLSKMDALMTAFNSYVAELSNDLWNSGHTNRANTHLSTVVNNTEQYVTYEQWGQFHTDVWDLADKLAMSSSASLKTAVENVVVDEWHNTNGTITSGDPNSHGMALYFGTISDTNGNLSLRNDYAYSNFTLFNEDSAWDSYLVDLYAFPPCTWIGDGMTYTSSLTNNGYDLFQFNIAQSGGILIDLTNYGTNDFNLVLFDDSWSEIASSWKNDPHESISTNLSLGWYILKVSSYSGASSYYVSLTNQGATIR